MKLSRYNLFLPASHNVGFLYNSLTDKFLFLKEGLWENLQTKLDESSSCWKNLTAGGFVVPDDLDELQLYITKARQIETDQSDAQIIINPTINCNFGCWYCYENHLPSKMTTMVMERIYRLIDKLCATSKSITISFFGGEPFLYYKDVMLPITQYAFVKAKQSGVYFSANCTTNGSLFTKKRISELKKYNFNFAQITLDGSENVHNKTRFFTNGAGSYQTIVKNIKDLANNQIRVTLRINYTQENIKSVRDIPDSFSELSASAKKNIYVSFHKVWQENEVSSDDIEAALKSFAQSGFIASEQVLGPYCYGDLRSSVVINYNGDVYKCTAVNFEESPRDGYLNSNGDIVWENNALEKRMSSKFTNKTCLDCVIFPICHGGCSSKTLEHNDDDYCIQGFDENRKKEMVMEKLIYNIRYVWKNHEQYKG